MTRLTRPETAFDRGAARYDSWFETHDAAYRSELLALRDVWPGGGLGLEVGVGTGRFAVPLGVGVGVDPSRPMLEYARDRGVRTVCAVAEELPFAARQFDRVLFVTTLCFVAAPRRALEEARRVLRADGCLVVAFIDAAGPLGRGLEKRRPGSPFFADARLLTNQDIAALLAETGFLAKEWRQAVFAAPAELGVPEAPRRGVGAGLFAVVAAVPTE